MSNYNANPRRCSQPAAGHRGARYDDGQHLVEHGILTEKADWRAHVCVAAGKVYFFQPALVARLISSGALEEYKTGAGQMVSGVKKTTSAGYRVPVRKIPGVVEVGAADFIGLLKFDNAKRGNGRIGKGEDAETIVAALFLMGFVPFARECSNVWEENDIQAQRNGIDLVVECGRQRFTVQVKCDYSGGAPVRREPWVSGNLYIETAERNPNGVR